MNKYLQQDTPTTETLLFKTSSIRMIELDAQTPLKGEGSFLWGREARGEGTETPNSSKAKICSMKTKALKEKGANTFLEMTSHSRVGVGVPGDRGTAR